MEAEIPAEQSFLDTLDPTIRSKVKMRAAQMKIDAMKQAQENGTFAAEQAKGNFRSEFLYQKAFEEINSQSQDDRQSRVARINDLTEQTKSTLDESNF